MIASQGVPVEAAHENRSGRNRLPGHGRPFFSFPEPRPLAPDPCPYAACWIAVSFHGFGPTGRTQVQYSSNFTGALSSPCTTAPVRSSTV